MESQMPDDYNDSKNHKSYLKIKRICKAIDSNMPIEVIKYLLQTEGDINYELPKNCHEENTLLKRSYEIKPAYFNLLLESGLDFTRKNDKGQTIVHEHLDCTTMQKGTSFRDMNGYKDGFGNAILSAHVKFNVTSNHSDENGISHFHLACIMDNMAVVEFFLKNGVDVNQVINENSRIFPMCTGLHLAAKYASMETVEVLLKYGANMLLKNSNGLTAMHLLIEICKLRLNSLSEYKETLKVIFKFAMDHPNNNIESIDDFGFCNLHLACILDDESLVESILENFENVNQAVNLDSPICSGCSALHFAAFSKIEIFKLLLNKGADIEIKNSKGQTPFDLCLQNYTTKGIHFIISANEKWKNIVMSDNETKLLDVITAFKSTDELIIFLNSNKSALTLFVPFDSPLWPGYTFLHLAVILAEQQTIEHDIWGTQYVQDTTKVAECLKRKADMTIADAKGSTALHLAFYMQKYYVVHKLLDHHDKSVNPVDQDNLSHFHIACAAQHEKSVNNFLSIGVDVNSPVLKSFEWIVEQRCPIYYKFYDVGDIYETLLSRRLFIPSGSTALHIDVTCNGNIEITKNLLKYGAEVQAKDVNGFTPVHRLLSNKLVLLHTGTANLLLEDKNLENCITDCGFSHLDVACSYQHVEAIEKLLKNGANVNSVLNYKGKSKKQYYIDLYDPYGDPDDPLNFLNDYVDYSPLHFAMQESCNSHVLSILIDNGADFLKKDADGNFFLKDLSENTLFESSNTILPVLKKSKILQNYFSKEFGWTELHVACCSIDLEFIKKLINLGVNVNEKIYSNCPVWKGYTPLHVVAEMAFWNRYGNQKVIEELKKIVQLLIKSGADLYLGDDNQNTPLHFHSKDDTSFFKFLFKCIKNYKVNPMNLQGISIFHIACLTDNVAVVEKFLKHNVDVNQAVNYFSEICPGGTPLHFTFQYCVHYRTSNRFSFKTKDATTEIVDKLIKKGANVNVADIYGETPLFGAVRLRKLSRVLIEKFISNGANVHIKNVFGNTPFELLLKQNDTSWEEIELFLKAGGHINTFNPISQQGSLGSVCYWKNDKIRSKLLDHSNMIEISAEGRTAIHNFVSVKSDSIAVNAEIIERLIIRGCNIDHQDKEGKTALHMAANIKNTAGVIGLLKNGADINVIDNTGKTFAAYVFESLGQHNEPLLQDVMTAFTIHIHKLDFCGLYINKQNKKYIDEDCPLMRASDIKYMDDFYDEIEKTKNINIVGTSLSVYKFLIDRHMDVVYMNMSQEERKSVDKFFENTRKCNFNEIDCLLRLKYKEAIQRTKLIEPALESLNVLTKYQLPDLCCRNILRFFFNEDLKNLIDSVN